jgi:hypothetical protein
MAMPEQRRDGYDDWKNDLLVAEYFELDRIQRAGGEVEKEKLYQRLGDIIDRKPGGVGNKFQNISAVLDSLNMEYARGHRPRPNIQQSLADAVERYLDAHPTLVFGESKLPDVGPADVIEVEAPLAMPPGPAIERTVERIARKYNHAERDARNRKLGALGEKLILEREKLSLRKLGKDSLADKVRHVSELDGDGVGYDIRSYDPSGEERLIEVKTTNGPATTAFFLSRTEHDVSLEKAAIWRLHRVHLFSSDPKVFILPPPLSQSTNLEIATWKASF